MKIVVRIDRLVLDGLPVERRDRPLLEAALRRELAARYLSGDDPLAGGRPALAGRRVRRITADPLLLPGSATPSGLGTAIARTVHGAIEGGRRT